MDTTTANLSDTLEELPPRLQAELLRHLRCADAVRAEERDRYRPDPVMGAWVELLDELEAGGPLMREVVRDSLEATVRPVHYAAIRTARRCARTGRRDVQLPRFERSIISESSRGVPPSAPVAAVIGRQLKARACCTLLTPACSW